MKPTGLRRVYWVYDWYNTGERAGFSAVHFDLFCSVVIDLIYQNVHARLAIDDSTQPLALAAAATVAAAAAAAAAACCCCCCWCCCC